MRSSLRFAVPAFLLVCLACMSAWTPFPFHLYVISEVYSSADGSVQFIELTASSGGQQFLTGQTITFTSGATMNTFTFPTDAPGDTFNHSILIGTSNIGGFAGGVAVDYVIPANFMLNTGGTIHFSGGGQTLSFGQLPTNGALSIGNSGAAMPNSPKNFGGNVGSINVPGGSCCNGATCSLALQSVCAGTFTLGGVCTPNPCGPPSGVCCTNGSCTFVVQTACTAGTWSQGGSCGGNPCPPAGVCCIATACTFVLQSSCSGTWTQGGSCGTNPCAPPSGACCFGSACRIDIAANCTGARRVFNQAQACNATAQATVPCCRVDFNHINGLGVQDIFDFLNIWFAGAVECNYIGNGTSSPTVQDIFAFINGWFAGC